LAAINVFSSLQKFEGRRKPEKQHFLADICAV